MMASAVMSRDGNGGTVALAINNRVCFEFMILGFRIYLNTLGRRIIVHKNIRVSGVRQNAYSLCFVVYG